MRIVALIVRLILIAVILGIPPATAAFIEWETAMANWSPWTRAGVGVVWAVLIFGAIAIFVSDEMDRKRHGR